MNIKTKLMLLLRPYVLIKGRNKTGNIALTFDDGPHKENTRQILKVLKENNVKSTFFIVGKEAEQNPELIKLMAQQGHEIANHSYSHIKNGSIIKDIEKAERVIQDILGVSSRYFRAPWGKISLSLLLYSLRSRKKIAMWSFDSQDHNLNNARQLQEYCQKSRIESGDILLFHEDYRHTLEALPEIIADLKSRGFTFNTISEMLELGQN